VTIVVGVDGSPESRAALLWAVEEGKLRHKAVRAVMAWDYPPTAAAADPYLVSPGYEAIAFDPQDLRSVAETRLSAIVEEVVPGAGEVEQVTVEGGAAEALLEQAADADMVVVGSRGHGGFSGLLLGSVSQQVAHHSTCPVVIVRERT